MEGAVPTLINRGPSSERLSRWHTYSSARGRSDHLRAARRQCRPRPRSHRRSPALAFGVAHMSVALATNGFPSDRPAPRADARHFELSTTDWFKKRLTKRSNNPYSLLRKCQKMGKHPRHERWPFGAPRFVFYRPVKEVPTEPAHGFRRRLGRPDGRSRRCPSGTGKQKRGLGHALDEGKKPGAVWRRRPD